jgi:hypothetical protein
MSLQNSPPFSSNKTQKQFVKFRCVQGKCWSASKRKHYRIPHSLPSRATSVVHAVNPPQLRRLVVGQFDFLDRDTRSQNSN